MTDEKKSESPETSGEPTRQTDAVHQGGGVSSQAAYPSDEEFLDDDKALSGNDDLSDKNEDSSAPASAPGKTPKLGLLSGLVRIDTQKPPESKDDEGDTDEDVFAGEPDPLPFISALKTKAEPEPESLA
ncbi:MAG: hypothetical protein K8F91_24935, partial [Candidatus Obscuribacterales bacterium]|nr:hypothetical protein [Candidatus Obscuribacterales bacterium]